MAQTFRTLAIFLTLAILVTIGIGFWSFFTPGESKYKDIFIVHFVCGLVTAIGILLVHCLIFIYFLGTGRWVKEVTLAYKCPMSRGTRRRANSSVRLFRRLYSPC